MKPRTLLPILVCFCILMLGIGYRIAYAKEQSQPGYLQSPETAPIYVDPYGSTFAQGSRFQPFQQIESGICKVGPNNTLAIQGGTYDEVLTIDTPARLTAYDGDVVIGQVAGKAHTTLKVVTYNTHLFGGTALGRAPQFYDGERAVQIAARVREESADVVGLQEVWDGDLATKIINQSGYPYSFYGSGRSEWSDVLHSGLLLLSKYPLINPRQSFYTDEEGCPLIPSGCDGWASKGFLTATIVKNGFQLGIFTTHTEAGHEPLDEAARVSQLVQLHIAIDRYLAANAQSEVIIMGDFNEDQSDENYHPMAYWSDLREALNNAPCFEESPFTVSSENGLERIFAGASSELYKFRLDYVFYSSFRVSSATGTRAFELYPTYAKVRQYQASILIHGVGDLSDHYGLAVEFSIYR